MPIYLYEREDGSQFEKLQKQSEPILAVCPDTGQKVTRKIAPTALHFKGSGFYKTDYTSSGAPKSDSSSSSDGSSSASGASCNGKGPAGGCGACSTE